MSKHETKSTTQRWTGEQLVRYKCHRISSVLDAAFMRACATQQPPVCVECRELVLPTRRVTCVSYTLRECGCRANVCLGCKMQHATRCDQWQQLPGCRTIDMMWPVSSFFFHVQHDSHGMPDCWRLPRISQLEDHMYDCKYCASRAECVATGIAWGTTDSSFENHVRQCDACGADVDAFVRCISQ